MCVAGFHAGLVRSLESSAALPRAISIKYFHGTANPSRIKAQPMFSITTSKIYPEPSYSRYGDVMDC